MAIFNRGVIQDALEICRSRARYMASSNNPEDRANAELYKLAARTYQDVANAMIEDGLPDDLSVYPLSLREAWSRFVRTGIVEDDIRELENAHVATLVRADGEPAKTSPARRPRLDRDLRDHVAPRIVETVIAEMCERLGLDYEGDTAPPTDKIPPGLVRAEVAAESLPATPPGAD